MSPQFVDFDADGHLDIVAGIFDGSPHVAFGTAQGFRQPQQILDRDGARIVLNAFWNFDSKKWDTTTRCDVASKGAGKASEGHLTSAVAFDWEGDGDLDLLLGDHRGGFVYLRRNEGTAAKPAFTTENEPVRAGDQLLCVPGTVATMRLVDWNRDGLLDLACGSMGDAYGTDEGGGVYVYPNTGSKAATAFGKPLVLVAPGKKTSIDGPERPDSGVYMDFADQDGDGDLDLVVGAYSHWTPKAPKLAAEQRQRLRKLKAEIAKLDEQTMALTRALSAGTQGLEEQAAAAKRAEILKAQAPERTALGKRRAPLQVEHDQLAPGPKRVPFVWLYENTSARAAVKTGTGAGGR